MKNPKVIEVLTLFDRADNKLLELVDDVINDLIDGDDTISSIIADTNAVGWSVDQSSIDKVESYYTSDLQQVVVAYLEFTLAGEQEEEKMMCGDSIEATCKVTLHPDGTYDVSDVKAMTGLEAECRAEDEDQHEEI